MAPMARLPSLLVFVQLVNSTAAISGDNCPQTVECSQCSRTLAICETPTTLIPTAIPDSVENLTISFTGQSVLISTDAFGRFTRLQHLSISGPVTAIEEGSFSQMVSLQSLRIPDSNFTCLPDNLFAEKNSLKELVLTFSALHFPHVPLPTNIFHQLQHLEVLDLKGYTLPVCPDQIYGLGVEFSYLRKLKQLSLSNLEIDYIWPCAPNDNLFINIPDVRILKLVNTGLFVHIIKTNALSSLLKLEYLDLSNTHTFAYEPNLAAEIFPTLPSSLTTLILQQWRSDQPVTIDYIINSTHLSALKKLPKLQHLSFRHSDLIFGFSISDELFHGFRALRYLDIGWCRISSIEQYAFDGCPNLTELVLDGNPLGPRRFQLYSRRYQTVQTLTTLSLKRTSVTSDATLTYDIVRLLRNILSIQTLDMSENFLHYMPRFLWGTGRMFNETYSIVDYALNNISKLILDNNWLQYVYASGFFVRDLRHCKAFHNISHLSIRNNRLKNIFGLCPTLTHLYLENNIININWDVNSEAIKSLASLEVLDLSSNQLTSLPRDLFSLMSNLRDLCLANNNNTHLPKALFDNNAALESIDLRANNITSVDGWNIDLLPNLKYLDLSDNSLTTIGMNFIQKLKTSSLELVALTGNRFTCICNEKYLKEFLLDTAIVLSPGRITCTDPFTKQVETVSKYEPSPWECNGKYILIYTAVAIGACLISACIILPCYKYWWFVSHLRVVSKAVISRIRELKYEHRCRYDAYVSYDGGNIADSQWIVDVLIPSIETSDNDSGPGIQLFIEDRDLPSGAHKYTEKCKALESSRKILIIISNSYLQSASCLGEADLAGLEMFGNEFYQPNRILVLLREELNEDFIKPPITSLLLQNVLMVKEGDERRLQKTLQKVRLFLSKPELVYRKSKRTRRRQLEERIDLAAQ